MQNMGWLQRITEGDSWPIWSQRRFCLWLQWGQDFPRSKYVWGVGNGDTRITSETKIDFYILHNTTFVPFFYSEFSSLSRFPSFFPFPSISSPCLFSPSHSPDPKPFTLLSIPCTLFTFPFHFSTHSLPYRRFPPLSLGLSLRTPSHKVPGSSWEVLRALNSLWLQWELKSLRAS